MIASDKGPISNFCAKCINTAISIDNTELLFYILFKKMACTKATFIFERPINITFFKKMLSTKNLNS